MKIAVFEKRPYEEKILQEYSNKYGIEFITTDEILDDKTINLCTGVDAVTTLGFSNLNSILLDKLNEKGVKYLSTRTVGFNHYDIDYAKKLGFKVSNVTYAPNGVADFTVMLMLISIRSMKVLLALDNFIPTENFLD